MSNKELKIKELNAQAKMLYSLGKYGEAVQLLKEAKTLSSSCQETYENLGVCYVMCDKYPEAKAAFKNVLVLDKRSALAHFHLGNLALLEGKTAEAKAEFSEAELCGFTDPIMFSNMAAHYEEIGDFDAAVQQYNKILRKDPFNLKVLGRKTQMLIRASRFEDALDAAKRMVKTDIDIFEGHHYTYVCLIMLQRYDEAGSYIEGLIERFPDQHELKFDQIRYYDLIGDVETAWTLLNEIGQDTEVNSEIARMKLSILLRRQNVDAAKKMMMSSEALKRDPDALITMFSVCFAQKDYQQALICAEGLKALGDEELMHPAAVYFVPLAKKYLGENVQQQFEEADEYLLKMSLQDPARVDCYLYRALIAYQINNLTEAKRLIEYLLAVESKAAPFHLTAYVIYEALGDKQQAQEHKATAAELDPYMSEPLV